MAYQKQHVLPANFEPPGFHPAPALAGLGVSPPKGAIESGEVPAYPRLLPTLTSFLVAPPASRAVRMIPSYTPAPAPGLLWRPVAPAGVMPPPRALPPPAWEVAGKPRPAVLAGLAAYIPSPTPLPLTATWGLEGLGQPGYRPVGLACANCPGSGLGQVIVDDTGGLVLIAALGLGAWLLLRRPVRTRLARAERRRQAISSAEQQLRAAEAMPGLLG